MIRRKYNEIFRLKKMLEEEAIAFRFYVLKNEEINNSRK